MELSREFVNIQIDVDQDKVTPQQYGIRAVPTLFFLDPDGQTIERYQGNRDVGSIATKLMEIGKRYKKGGD